MFCFGCQQYMVTLHVVDYITFMYLASVHFSDIPHTFIPHFTVHSAEKNPHRIFCKLPLDNFPHLHFAFYEIPLPRAVWVHVVLCTLAYRVSAVGEQEDRVIN